jgi:hypothetical protein
MATARPVGSKRLNHNGYVQVKLAMGERRWHFEHRVVWEAANGPIPPGQFIHHLNGIKTDNRLENLTLCANNADHHHRFHAEEHSERGRKLGGSGRGKPKSAEHRAKIAAANRGKPKSPEHRAKLAAALRGRKNPEHAARMRDRVPSAATRDKHRIDIMSRPRDPLTGRILKSA